MNQGNITPVHKNNPALKVQNMAVLDLCLKYSTYVVSAPLICLHFAQLFITIGTNICIK